MMSRKLAVFDIDGTIAQKGVVDPAALKGIKHLQTIGYSTTLSTGRSYNSMKYAMGKLFDEIVSDDALIILEQGTRICDKKGNTFFAEYLGPEEIGHIIDFMRTNNGLVHFAWFNPDESERPQLLWSDEPAKSEAEMERRKDFAEATSGPLAEFKELLLGEKLTQIECRLPSHIFVQNLRIGLHNVPLNIILQDKNMTFIKNNTNKGLSVLYLMKHMGIDYEDVLVAGNAVNDLEMLDLGVGKRILVGPKDERDTVLGYMSETAEVVQLPSPAHLGLYLQKL